MSISNHPVEQEELMAYLDGELPADRATETASHLEKCQPCQKLAADLQEVSEMLMAWQVEESKLELTEDVAEALNKRRSHKTGSVDRAGWHSLLNPRHWPKPAWGLAVVGLIAAVFVTSKVKRMSAGRAIDGYYTSASRPQDAIRTPERSTPASQPGKKSTSNPNADYAFSPNGSASYTKPAPPPPLSAPTPRPSVGSVGKFQKEETDEVNQEEEETSGMPTPNGPMIVRTAELAVTTEQFDKARSSVEEILKRHHGHVGELNVNTPPGSARSLTGTLRVPSNRLDSALADLRGLGRVEKESQSGEEVTQQYIDLQARLANAKHTEQRLTDILRERTGKLSDVLAVEMQISRVRGEIEQMEAQRKTMKNQVDFATVTVTVNEAYKAELKAVPPSTGTQFRNAAVEGYRSLVDGIISVLLWLLSVGPTLLLWAAILFFPARMAWRRLQPKFAK